MRRLISFTNSNTLKEQVLLIRRNDPLCLIGVIMAAAIVSYVIYSELPESNIAYWFASIILITIPWFISQRFFTSKTLRALLIEARVRAFMAVIYGLIWAWMAINYLPQSNPLMMVTISMVTGAAAAGSVSAQSPSLPQCFGFVSTILLSVIVGLLLRGGPTDIIIATGGILYYSILVMCMLTMETTIHEAIQLRHDKEVLVEQLSDALTDTEEANTAKSMFLASASHDLRQPVQAMSLVTEAMKNTSLDAQQQKLHKYLQSALDSATGMLNSLLDFSKIDAGVVTAKPKPFSVNRMLKRLKSELTPHAHNKNLKLHIRKTDAIANSDEQIIEMILRNLITNAIRYTEEGRILLACRKRKNNILRFEVWDTGIGISEQDKEIIFKEFRQVDDVKEQGKQKGFGLGLAISEGLATALGSTINVESMLGHGSVFHLSVPASEAPIIDDMLSQSADLDLHGRSILVIDDNERIRDSMQTLLESWGCHCATMESSEEALPQIAHRKPDVMLVDYRLGSDKTGSQAINTIRTFLDKDIPAIIITGDSAEKHISEVSGSQPGFMRKPVSAKELKQMINEALQANNVNDVLS